MLYNVEFLDGSVKQYSANVIAKNIISQVDQDEFSQMLIRSIIDYSKDGCAVTKENMYVTTKANFKRLHQTTICWKMIVKFRDGSEQ